MDELIPIGQFAGLTWLSPKALRLYQAQSLLEPEWVDPHSGYRYYHPSQIPVATHIGVLRCAGVSGHLTYAKEAPTMPDATLASGSWALPEDAPKAVNQARSGLAHTAA